MERRLLALTRLLVNVRDVTRAQESLLRCTSTLRTLRGAPYAAQATTCAGIASGGAELAAETPALRKSAARLFPATRFVLRAKDLASHRAASNRSLGRIVHALGGDSATARAIRNLRPPATARLSFRELFAGSDVIRLDRAEQSWFAREAAALARLAGPPVAPAP